MALGRRVRWLPAVVSAVVVLSVTNLPRVAEAGPLFADGFERGDLSSWTASSGFIAQNQVVFDGSWAGRATSTGSAAYVSKSLATTQSDLYFDARFDVLSAAGTVAILRFRAAAGTVLLSLQMSTSGKLVLKNFVTSTATTSATAVTLGVWHEAQLHATVNGASSLAEVWFDGVKVADLSGTIDLGTTPIGRVQLGTNGTTSGYDAAFDDAVADTAFIGGTSSGPPATPTNLHASSISSTEVDLAWSPSAGATSYTVRRDTWQIGTPATASYDDVGLLAATQYSYTVDACNGAGCSAETDPLAVTTLSTEQKLVAAAGDIACDPTDTAFNGGLGDAKHCHQKYTAALLAGADAVLALGDNQYMCGGYQAYLQSYDLSWGQSKAITDPVTGNHEYRTSGGTDCGTNATGYFTYFGAAAGDPTQGYYSFDVGSWHLIALNSNCKIVSCKAGSAQERWLAADLAAHPVGCTIAYWHHPAFFSSTATNTITTQSTFRAFWNDLYAAHADLVLNGHRHIYERFTRLDPTGTPNASGMREFIVGTGGASLDTIGTVATGSEFRDASHYGVLKLTLSTGSYAWSFVTEDGSVIDAGSDTCV